MRALVIGDVVDVKDSSWTNSKGERVESFDVYVRQDGSSLAFGADRLTCPAEHLPSKGDTRAAFMVSFRAKINRNGEAYLNAFVVERFAAPLPAAA